jgi:hypothetical protein
VSTASWTVCVAATGGFDEDGADGADEADEDCA